ncbi:MAG: conjugal transfer protein TraR [Candidatus Kerfeldbacteria bacterium CG08_land_8_20_14_0_20_40_16]|uniref:Conjugal transfer protein TraR n=1 Tax=Candidatus Kerfeldbacteria bacterium CG08_land_8_20_14_0_20_40_16 TaxID=2014244 RepID=A0A2H0YVK6_9BACT|nr:MAG: conjugal transfer protein TraR [Candidatus Kerfeldbacteria bacterium CG08_land_8_20_14_0_20_40_16]
MTLIIWLFIFIVSLIVLIFSADRFTKAAEKLGVALGIPAFIVGITIVSIGTSLPELMTSLLAVFRSTPVLDATPIVVGDVVGSNIANILLITGIVVILVRKLEVKRSLIELDIPLLLLSTALLILVAYDGVINWMEGIILLLGLGVYLRYSLSDHAREKVAMGEEEKIRRPIWGIFRNKEQKARVEGKLILNLIIFSILIYIGARYTIDSLINISDLVGIGTSVLAASAIAVGTSLPELFVSGAAALRGNHDIAIGNIFGSNIFNALFIIGVPALIKPLTVPTDVLQIGIPFLIGATVVYVFSAISRKIYIYEGAIYLLIYVVFIAKLFKIF